LSMRSRTLCRLGKARFEAMVEEATVDCYNPSEQATGWLTMIEENLKRYQSGRPLLNLVDTQAGY